MTEEKNTPKRTPAAKKTAASAVTTVAEASKTPAVKKTTPVATEKKTPAKKAVQTTSAGSATQLPPTAEERYLLVQSAAYFIAERDGFQGCDTHYWALAEQEIAAQLGETTA